MKSDENRMDRWMGGWIIWHGMAFWLWDSVSATAPDAGTYLDGKDDLMFS